MHSNCIKFYHFFSCSEPNLLVRACNQLGQFLQHRETNLRYLALESMCTLASSEFSHEAVKTHIETVINALKVCIMLLTWNICILSDNQYCLYSMTENSFLFHLFKSNRWLFIRFLSVFIITVLDWEGCECPTEGSRFAVCNVWSKQCQTDCSWDAQLSWDGWLLHQRGDGMCLSP